MQKMDNHHASYDALPHTLRLYWVEWQVFKELISTVLAVGTSEAKHSCKH